MALKAALSYDEHEGRLLLAVPRGVLEQAALAVPGTKRMGAADGFIIFGVPPTPQSYEALLALDPLVHESANAITRRLGQQLLAVRHTANLKQDLSPIDFEAGLVDTIDPMPQQNAAMRFTRSMADALLEGAALLMEQGTGKTLIAIAIANYLRRAGRIKWALVIAPNSLKGTWGADAENDGEIAKCSADPCTRIILRGAKAKRVTALQAATEGDGPLPWVITNYDQFSVETEGRRADPNFGEFLAAVKAAGPFLLVLDEAARIKNGRAKRTKAVLKIADEATFTMPLTGTPVTSGPLDVYPQFEAIKRGALGYRTYLAFERDYAVKATRRFGGRLVRETVGYQNLEELARRVDEWSYRVRAADCLNLPPVVTRRLTFEISPEQMRIIKQLVEDYVAEFPDGAHLDGRNILTRYLRIGQVLGGHVKTDEEELRALSPNPRMSTLFDYLESVLDDPTAKAVVFAQGVPEVIGIVGGCEQRGWAPVPFYGAVPEAERDKGRSAFRGDPARRVFVAQYQCGSEGLNLTAANHLIFYSLTFKLGDMLQARKRVHRKGQTRQVSEAYLIAENPRGRRRQRSDTLDHHILAALDIKKGFADVVTGDRQAALDTMQGLV